MRWKIQIFASLALAALAVLVSLAISRLLIGSFTPGNPLLQPLRVQNLALVVPAVAAAIFVYRHTAIERKTQAVITFFLTVALAIGALMLIARFL